MVPIYYLLAKRQRAAIAHGLIAMHKDKLSAKELDKLVYKTLDNMLKTNIDKYLYPKLDKKYCDKYIDYTGLEHLDEALKAGRGVVLLHGHFGNPHLIMPAIGYKDYKLTQLASRNQPEKLSGPMSGLVNLIRYKCYETDTAHKEKLPVNFIYVDRFLRAPFEALERNEILAIGLDGREGVKSIELDFLNRRAIFYTGSMRLILRAKPVVLPTFHVRNTDNTHKIIIEEPMKIDVSGNGKKDIMHNTRKFISLLEKYVYTAPWLYAQAFCLKDPFFIDEGSKANRVTAETENDIHGT